MNPFLLEGRRILITGASSGIGRETALWLSQVGAKLVLIARDQVRLDNVLSQLQGEGHATERIDLAAERDIPGWMRTVVGRHGKLHGLVHAAGVQQTLPIRALSEDKWNEVMHINSTVSFLLAKAFRQKQVNEGGGSIVLLSSVVSLAGQPGLAAYSASKGAVNALTRTLALELAAEQIRVNAVAPGVVQTEMSRNLAATIGEQKMSIVESAHPIGLGEPRDVAYAVNYLLSPAARWVTGSILVADGGYLSV